MVRNILPLKEVNINEIFNGSEKCTYEIPIYQRNYAWESDEIRVLIQDVYDAYNKKKDVYYIGTLVCYHKGDSVFEIIDGQQRLTTIRLILESMDVKTQNRLTYRARKKSDDTLKAIPSFNIEEKDIGIVNGYRYAENAIKEIIPKIEMDKFKEYFIHCVKIIQYHVPKDIDLNHYFEIMNSRGEQLEKHEIVKAYLMEKLSSECERRLFNNIWESCSELNFYIQQIISGFEEKEDIFGEDLHSFQPSSFDDLLKSSTVSKSDNEQLTSSLNLENDMGKPISINCILESKNVLNQWINKDIKRADSFLPIIDFPNFLLIVLKITKIEFSVP